MTLADLKPGESGIIQGIDTEGLLLRRLLDLGLLPGTHIDVRFRSQRGDPVAYMVRGTILALRRSTACKVIVHSLGRSGLCPQGT